MNGCPYNVPSFNLGTTIPRPVIPRRVSSSSGVSLTTFIIFALLMFFLISEVYTYARKVCLDHQRRMRAMCVSHQVALDAKLQRICSAHKKCFEERLEEVRCKCDCKCEDEETENCYEEDLVDHEVEKPETEFERVEENMVLDTIPEESTDHFGGFKTD